MPFKNKTASPLLSLYWFLAFKTKEPSLNSMPIANLQKKKRRYISKLKDELKSKSRKAHRVTVNRDLPEVFGQLRNKLRLLLLHIFHHSVVGVADFDSCVGTENR